MYGPCSCGGSAWHRQFDLPHLVMRFTSPPGSIAPSARSPAIPRRAASARCSSLEFITRHREGSTGSCLSLYTVSIMEASTLHDADSLRLRSEVLGAMPIIDAFCERLGLADLFESFVPNADARVKLGPGASLGVLVRNLVLHREPVYAIG